MSDQLKVWHVLAACAIIAATPSPAPARDDDRVALVICDLLNPDTPEVQSVDVGGGGSRDRDFIGGRDRDRDRDFRGRRCAEVLAALRRDGFKFQEPEILGRNSDRALYTGED